MSMEIPHVGGKNWLVKGLLQALVISLTIVGTLAINNKPSKAEAISDQVIYQMQQTIKELGSTAVSNQNRLTRIETWMEDLRGMPSAMAGVKATLDAVKNTVDDTKRKIDTHVIQR